MNPKFTFKYLLIIFYTVSSLNVFGQKHLIGFTGGINWANRSPNSNSSNRIGISSGLTYQYMLNQRLSIEANLLYSQKGFQDEVQFVNANQVLIGVDEVLTKTDYLSLPIKTGYYLGKSFYGFLNIGVIPSILLKANLDFPSYYEKEINNDNADSFNIYNETSKFDLAGLAEIGAGIKISNKYHVFTSFTYQKSFTKFLDEESYTLYNMNHVGKVLSIGFKYAIPN
jgi:Outer membrane protein beta-barrel domain